MPTAKPNRSKNIPVVVTTAHRGVFFGYVATYKDGQKALRIKHARMCVYWSEAMKGVLGLATTGPDKKCKIGPRVPVLMLNDVTAIMEMTADAVFTWEAAPWR